MKIFTIFLSLVFLNFTFWGTYKANGHLDYTKNGNNWDMGQWANGQRQSPIDIMTKYLNPTEVISINSNFEDIVTGYLHYQENELKVTYKGAHIQFISKQEKSNWTSAQFHFHSPSEHRINGETFDLEIHVVLQRDYEDSQLLVFGILFKLDEKAPNNDIFEK